MRPSNFRPTLFGRSGAAIPKVGFTLAELLAVIAVVGILSALMAGTVVRTLRKARETRCKNNLRQLVTVMTSYVGSRGQYPGWTNPEIVGGETNAWLWPHALEREMTSNDEHIPPRFKGGLKGSVWDCPERPPDSNGGVHIYGYNNLGLTSTPEQAPLGLGGKVRQLSLIGMPDPPQVPVKEGDVLSPSRMIALGDGVSGWNDFMWASEMFGRFRPIGDERYYSPRVSELHGQAANAAFADGHVEVLASQVLFKDTTPDALRLWNRDNQPHRERLTP